MDQSHKQQKLFKLVWNNIYLYKLIYKYKRLYEQHQDTGFNKIEYLQQYKYRSYIQNIVFTGDVNIKKGDLPINGVLEYVKFSSRLPNLTGDEFPYGLKEIHFYKYCNQPTPISKLPSSIHTIINARIPCNNKENLTLPPNITSISFIECPNITPSFSDIVGNIKETSFLKLLPNTVQTLSFPDNWCNNGVELSCGDIPDGVTSLTFELSCFKFNLKRDVLPTTIKYLNVKCTYPKDGMFDFLDQQLNIETMCINLTSMTVMTSNTNLHKCKSVKKLKIKYYGPSKPGILPTSGNLKELIIEYIIGQLKGNTIPNSVVSLKLEFKINTTADYILKNQEPIEQNTIPNSVTSLIINRIITQPNLLPNSITHLDYSDTIDYIDNEIATKMMSVLPISINSLILPDCCEFLQNIYNRKAISNHITKLQFK